MTIPRSNHGVAVTGAENQSSGGDEPSKVNYDQIADYLTDGYWEGVGGSRRAFDVAPGGTLTADITGLTAAGQQLARWSLEAWTNVTGINFRFVESDADITFDDEERGALSRFTNISGGQIISSFVNVSADWLNENGSTIDSYSFFTYIHEIGHALGLGHAGPYNETGSYGVDNIFPGDSWQATVMSYFDQDENTYINASYAYAVTPMIADVIAIQNLYGVPTDINAGDTVYGYQSNLDGYLGQLSALVTGEGGSFDQPVAVTLYDTGGSDTLDLRTDTADQRVDLRPESISDVYGLVGNLSIARDTLIENFIAGSGKDRVTGNAVANRLAGGAGNDELWGSGGGDVLEGGAGADRLDGGLGADTVSYSGSDEAVTMDLEAGTGKGGHAEGDVIVDVENVLGSGYGDVLGGDDGANRLSGAGGNDELSGRGGDDVLEGGVGADQLDGGAGMDTVSYSGSDEAVTVDLEAGTGEGGHAEGDVIMDIENVLGSGYRDVLGGDGGANRLFGAGGNDELSGRGGDDVLEGGAGADQLNGGAGVDMVSYSGSNEAVTVDLEAGTGEGGHAEGDVIVDVENVLGSGYEDVLGGDDGANRLSGGDGDDMLDGGAGADRLFGGAGVDTVSYARSDRGVTVYLSEGTVKRGHAQGDVIVNFENVLGSVHGDVLGGDDGGNRLSGGGGNDRLLGGAGDDMLEGGAGADQLFGGAGVDTVSYAGSDRGVTVYLSEGTVKRGHAEGDAIVNFENVLGSVHGDVLGGDDGANRLSGGGGNDRLLGGAGDDMLEGGAGADQLFGGAGVDTVSYAGSDRGVTVYLSEGTVKRGDAQGDVIVSFENVLGSVHGDVLGGDDGGNRLSGGGGNDRLLGAGGDDVLEGGAGADQLFGGAGVDTVSYAGSDRGVTVYLSEGTVKRGDAQGDVIVNFENVLGSGYGDVLGGDDGGNRLSGGGGNDRLLGGAGDDMLEGGAGADQLFGGAGVDTVSYAGSDRGVTVYLSEGTVKRGHAEGDAIVNFENVLGSVHGDVLGGDDGANRLSGGGGNDRLLGGAGDDVLEGGAGADQLFGGAGVDTVSYAGSDRGVTVYLSEGTVKRGDAQGDVIVSFENVLGSVHGDVLGGDDGGNRLSGGGGNDRLLGAGGDDVLEGGAGADQLFGGAGVDTVSYAGSDRGVTVYLSEGTVKRGDAQGDVIVNFENVLGSGYGDVLGGDDGGNRLSGGGGNDRLLGRGGDDVFIFDFGHGDDIIADFTNGDDLIDLSAFGLSSFDELVVSSGSDGVTIDLVAHGGGTIRLESFNIADLDAGDFLFS